MNTSLKTNAPRLLAGGGTLTLLVGLGLLSSRPAHTAGGPIPVTVANTPLAVISADPAILQPYVQEENIPFASGSVHAGNVDFAVPVGKRLVVQTVSVIRSGAVRPGYVSELFMAAKTNGRINDFALPPLAPFGAPLSGTSQAITFQADSGLSLSVYGYRNTIIGYESDFVTVSGYLVDAP